MVRTCTFTNILYVLTTIAAISQSITGPLQYILRKGSQNYLVRFDSLDLSKQ
jgi:hypothetical protein